jgi:hypothetical protein
METENAAARVAADDLVVRTVQQHADSLLRLARRHSLCTDDAYDAYQRGLEIFLKHAPRLEPATAHQWLHTVVKRKTSIGLTIRRASAALVRLGKMNGYSGPRSGVGLGSSARSIP